MDKLLQLSLETSSAGTDRDGSHVMLDSDDFRETHAELDAGIRAHLRSNIADSLVKMVSLIEMTLLSSR